MFTVQAFSEFRNLVTKLTDTSVQIQDVNVRGTIDKYFYHSI